MNAMFFLRILSLLINSHELPAENIIPRKNSVGIYFGILEGNINYERNILVFPHSYLNVRTGWVQWSNFQAEGDIYNLTLVFILGKRLSHLELNGGAKFIKMKPGNTKDRFYPDAFIGYRIEKPDGRIYVRVGAQSLSLMNIGAGIKF